jgi:prepilin-type N-terminal cleavage/methylation domain-containing protein
MNAPREILGRRAGVRAFTLIEMMVVVAIISILMTIGVIGMNAIGGKSVSGGVSSAEALFEEARYLAVGKRVRTCVLVARSLNINRPDELRRLLVAHEEINATTGAPLAPTDPTPRWVITSRGSVLPKDVYFSTSFSKKDHKAATDLDFVTSADLVGLKASYAGTYFVYEFDADGIARHPGASFVIGIGKRNQNVAATGANRPRVDASAAKRDFGGFLVMRNGSVSVFRDPDQIFGTNPPTTYF